MGQSVKPITRMTEIWEKKVKGTNRTVPGMIELYNTCTVGMLLLGRPMSNIIHSPTPPKIQLG